MASSFSWVFSPPKKMRPCTSRRGSSARKPVCSAAWDSRAGSDTVAVMRTISLAGTARRDGPVDETEAPGHTGTKTDITRDQGKTQSAGKGRTPVDYQAAGVAAWAPGVRAGAGGPRARDR